MRTIDQRNALVQEHLQLAEKLAGSRYQTVNQTVQYGELLSAAYSGLIDAADKFDETKASEHAEKPFVTYARKRIKGEMNDYLRTCNWGTRSNPQQMLSLESCAYSPGSRYVGERSGSASSQTLGEVACGELQSALDAMSGEEIFNKIIRCLPKREKRVFQLRYLYGLTMKEVADNLDISESRVSQILSKNTEYLQEVWKERADELWDEVTVSY